MAKYPWENLTRRQSLELLGAFAAATALPRSLQAKEPDFPQGAIIRTVLKDYAPAELAGGATLFHEHIHRNPGKPPRSATPPPPGPWQPAPDNLDISTAEARAAKAAADLSAPTLTDPSLMAIEVAKVKENGVACIVDAGHPDMGRDINFVRQVSQKSGVPIVASGGYYTQSTYPKELAAMDEADIVKELIKQADDDTIGAWGEIGSGDKISDLEQKVFRAVGKAHLETNMGIFTHTARPGKMAVEQLDIFEKAGVNPNRVVIGHLGDIVDDPKVTVQKSICKRGAFIGYDRHGYGDSDAPVVPMVLAMIEAGYADNLMFSADTSGSNFSRVVRVFVPRLKAAGVSDEILHGILVNNSRRFLAFVPKRPRKA